MSAPNGLVQRLWSYCNVLRDDGLSYGDYLEQLTYLLFLKMADEQTKPPFSRPLIVPQGLDWQSLLERDGDALEVHYRYMLTELARKPGMLGVVFRKAQNRIQDPAKLRRLIVDLIDRESWLTLDADVKGDAYEGLLEKNAEDVKSGAGQYFTPRPLIRAIVDVMRPEPGTTIADPACGTGGFLLAAYEWIATNHLLDPDEKRQLRFDALRGWEIVDNTARLCVMNLLLHGIGDEEHESPIIVDDALKADPGERFEMVLTNPPFGRKSSITFVSDEGEVAREDLVVVRDDFWASTSNKQLNFVQHVKTLLAIDGRAAVVVPDNVLFEGGAGETVRRKLMHECEVHTLLRLPTGIFYRPGVKANVLFFERRPASETPWTQELWVYDLRTNQHFTLKQNPMRAENLHDFVTSYNAEDRRARVESERFRRFGYDELIARDRASLDIAWLKDESLEGTENMPSPEVIAQEIVEDLEAALSEFVAIVEALRSAEPVLAVSSDNAPRRRTTSLDSASAPANVAKGASHESRGARTPRPPDTAKTVRTARPAAPESLVSSLKLAGGPLSPEDLLSASGYDATTSDAFYRALREAIAADAIKEVRAPTGEIILQLARQ